MANRDHTAGSDELTPAPRTQTERQHSALHHALSTVLSDRENGGTACRVRQLGPCKQGLRSYCAGQCWTLLARALEVGPEDICATGPSASRFWRFRRRLRRCRAESAYLGHGTAAQRRGGSCRRSVAHAVRMDRSKPRLSGLTNIRSLSVFYQMVASWLV